MIRGYLDMHDWFTLSLNYDTVHQHVIDSHHITDEQDAHTKRRN